MRKSKVKDDNNLSETSDLLVYFNINEHKFCLSYNKQYILNEDNWQNAYYDLLNSDLMPEVLSCLSYEEYVNFVVQSIKENNIQDFRLSNSSNHQNTNDITVKNQNGEKYDDNRLEFMPEISLSLPEKQKDISVMNTEININKNATNNIEKTNQHNRYTQQKVNLQTNEQNNFLIEIYTREIKNLSLCLTNDFNQNISTINKIDFLINRIKICDVCNVLNKLNDVNEQKDSNV